MIIDGEKYACDACVRGHRVSNCQHADRRLQHINKKGRPVTQCQHCRSMRRSRSAHVKCDCGEKTHKCMHLQSPVEGHKESCCCNHGGRCSCSHKKDQPHLDTVLESDSDRDSSSSVVHQPCSKPEPRNRRRANTIHADGVLAFDENGHHKPTYRHPKASQKSGPYQLKRGNSLHSSDLVSHKRSVDDLGREFISGVVGASSQKPRQVRSETASPLLAAMSLTQTTGQLPPLDLSAIEYPAYPAGGYDFFGNLSDHEQPMFSAGLSATSVDWSHYEGLDSASRLAENFAPSSYSQAQSFGGGLDQPPTLTTSTSGDVSEVEDSVPTTADDRSVFSRTATGSSTFDIQGVVGSMDFGAEFDDFKSKFVPAATTLAEAEATVGANTSATGSASFPLLEDDPAYWMGDYSHGLTALNDTSEPAVPAFWE